MNTNTLVVQTINKVYCLDANFKDKVIPIDLNIDPKQYQCKRVIPGYDQNQNLLYLFSLCIDLQSANQNYVIIPITYNQFYPFAAQPIVLDIVSSISSVEYIDDVLLVNENKKGVVYAMELNFASKTYSIIATYDSTVF